MPTIPPPSDTTLSRIWKHYEAQNNGKHRTHLGASIIGNPCERAIWYKFRWAKAEQFEGRVLRLFETGRRAEERLADDLRATGAVVHLHDPDTGEQFNFQDHGGHFAGSMDGAGVGFVEAPATWHVIEFKTHNDKSFAALIKSGVQEAKPEHFDQMQTYMGWSGMTRALYVALNKDTDDLHIERVRFDKAHFERIRQKAKAIIYGAEPPDRMNESPAFYLCKWCSFNWICHEMGEVADTNCRTCEHSVALEDGSWGCDRHQKILSVDDQRVGCQDHRHRAGMIAEAARRVVKEFGGKVVKDDDEVPF